MESTLKTLAFKMGNESTKVIKAFFRSMGAGFLILCIKINIIKGISYDLVKSLWYTFMYCATVSIWVGVAGMFSTMIYLYIKKNFISIKIWKLYAQYFY